MLSNKQTDKLSDLFMDLAKGSFLAGFAITSISGNDWILLTKAFGTGTACAAISLILIRKITK